tara:strand:+ start:233 stop:508 length:276 start_codon:yes stop_codon:yes gene_type:complete
MSRPVETIADLVQEQVDKLMHNEIEEVRMGAVTYICDIIADSDRPNDPFQNQIHALVNEYLHTIYGKDIDQARNDAQWVKFALEQTFKGRI